jgi:hypothetical protein
LGVERGANNPSLKKACLLQNVSMSHGPRQILWINDLSEGIWDMRFDTWNIRTLYRVGSLMTVSRELTRYRLDLVGVQEFSGTAPVGEYTFFYAKGNENHELGTGFFFEHKKIYQQLRGLSLLVIGCNT